MIIDRATYKTIEYYFYNYHKLRAEVINREILNHANYNYRKTGIHGTTISNPEQSAINGKLSLTEKGSIQGVERFKGRLWK